MNSSISGSEKKACLRLLATGFAAALLLCAVAGESFLRSHVVPRDLFWKHIDLVLATKTPDAAFGDSLIARGFTGTERYVNLAYPGDNLDDMRATVKAYYKDKKPGNVILQAGPQIFAKRAQEGRRDVAAILGGAPRTPYLLDDYYRVRLVEHLRHTDDDFDKATAFQPYGGILTDHDVAQTFRLPAFTEALLKSVKAETPLPGFENGSAAAVYTDTAQWLKAQGARVCMVTMPAMPAYRAAAKMDAAFTYFRAVARETGAKYVSYWDAFDNPRDFINGTHLSKAGAVKLSPRIIHDCFN